MELTAQVDRILSGLRDVETDANRTLIAIAGPPASGKSTLAENLQARLIAGGTPCGLVPMDGFHLDNSVLQPRGLLARKGAPETFDVTGFASLIAQLTIKPTVPVPMFDRSRDCVLPNASQITPDQRVVVVEGNYLFLQDAEWSGLSAFWTYTVFLSPELAELEKRLIQRWHDHGMDRDTAEARVRNNDLINARTILERSDVSKVDLLLR